jgi:hypothetical protein
MRLIRPLVLMMVLLAASCADAPPTSDVGAQPPADGGAQMAGLTASCGGAVFDRLPPDTSAFAPFTSFDELDLSRVGGEAPYLKEFASGYEWFVTQEGEGWRQLFGQPSTSRPDGDPPYASLRIEMRDGEWAPVGWGQCRIELVADGWGNARFVVDPDAPPDPEAGRISVLATEGACAGGLAPEEREVRAVILDEDERSVSIVILVEPTKGATTCQGNPAFPFEVELGSPLGERKILDASVYPPEQQWP